MKYNWNDRLNQALSLMKSGQDSLADLRLRAEVLLECGNRKKLVVTEAECDVLERISLAPIEDDRDWLGTTFDERLKAAKG